MKKILTIIILLLPFLFIGEVKAFDEYRVYLESSTSITVRKTTGDSSGDFTSVLDYSDILSYSNGKLTLNEGYYFDLISIRVGGVTITSNSKHVYLNSIFDSTRNSNRSVTIDKLNSDSFVSNYESLIKMSSEKLYSIIYVSGDLTITDSNINLSAINPKVDGTFNGNIATENGNLYVDNSTIISEAGLCSGNQKTLTLKNSSFEAKNVNGQGYIFGTFDGPATIENCTITGTMGLVLSGDATVTNCILNIPDFIAYSVSSTPNITVKNTEMNLNNSFDLGMYSDYNSIISTANANVTLDNTKVKLNNKDVRLYMDSKLYLTNNSSLECDSIVEDHSNDNSLLSINNSELKTKSITLVGSIFFKDSKINIPTSGSIKGSNSITLDNINDLKLDHISSGDLTINSVNVDLAKSLITTGDVDINDSIFKSNGTRVSGNFTLDNSIYKTHYLNEEKTYSPFIVVGDVDISNSSFLSESDGTVPSILVKGDIDIKDSSFKDNNKHVLDISEVQVSNSNFLSSNEIFGNASYVNVGDLVKTTTLNGELSNYSEISKHYEVVIKVVNGTWGNGTSDDITLKIVIGDEVEGYLPTDMIPNYGYTKGKWEKVDDKYVYTFVKENVVNPKTGVISTLGLLIIISFLLTYLIKNKNRFSVFRRI